MIYQPVILWMIDEAYYGWFDGRWINGIRISDLLIELIHKQINELLISSI